MFILVCTTTGSAGDAKKIAKKLVRERLIACANYFPIKSIYSWKGKICSDSEYLLMCKTTKSKFTLIKKAIKDAHKYELPEIISIDIVDGEQKYLNWVVKSTSQPKAR